MQSWTHNRINVAPWQNIPETLKNLGLTTEDVMTQVWFVSENGRLYGAAEAVNRSLWSVWWLRPLTRLYYLPGLRQLEEWIYRWVARNRHRLPGGAATCALPNPKTEDSTDDTSDTKRNP